MGAAGLGVGLLSLGHAILSTRRATRAEAHAARAVIVGNAQAIAANVGKLGALRAPLDFASNDDNRALASMMLSQWISDAGETQGLLGDLDITDGELGDLRAQLRASTELAGLARRRLHTKNEPVAESIERAQIEIDGVIATGMALSARLRAAVARGDAI